MSDIEVTDNTERHRFEITSDGAEAGFADYELAEGVIELTHTVVRDGFEGQGIGGKLVSHALDSARSRDLRVVPTCSFVKGYVEKHPEYADLVG
ncbi:GNAT family N-acetyltransferase [Nocardioides psychrotolerans]|uniref:GNAT family N-acetyltransferase n=1 Tax=Nocardioides psychrotolerans TaxID=1005945 RepID=UPI003137DAA4